MIDSKEIKKFARDIFSKNRGQVRKFALIHPERDWFFILSFFILSFLVGIMVSLWHFHTYRTLPNNITGSANTPLPHFSTRTINEVHDKYQNKETEFLQKLKIAEQNNTSTSSPAEKDTTSEAPAEDTDGGQTIEVTDPENSPTQTY